MNDFSKTGKFFAQLPNAKTFTTPTVASSPPVVTRNMASHVSQYRRDTLEGEVNQGLYRDAGAGSDSKPSTRTALGNVTFTSKPLYKAATDANTASNSFTSNYRGTGGTVRQAPEIYSPLWLTSNLSLPRDRATINAWCRAFFALNPIVHNAISLHSTYPISRLNIKCKNKKIEKFFQDMIEEIDLMNVCVQIAQEYWTLGEAFVYAELDQRSAKWNRLMIQNPDYISVTPTFGSGEPIISLRPDENLKKIVMQNSPANLNQRQKLPRELIEHVRRGENIPLASSNISHIARKIAPYETRGTGLPVACFRQLMLLDKLRECKFTQAESMVNPLMIFKVGGGTGEFKATPADLEEYRNVLEQSVADRNFKIITHDDVTCEIIGYGSGIYDTSGDITQLWKETYIGLMVPSVLMDGGDVTYANAGVALDVLRQRYMQFRNMMTYWLRRKIFAPISKINEFYDHVAGEKILIVPDIDWNHMPLFDTTDYINSLIQLTQDPASKRASLQTLYRSMGLDWEEEKRKMKEEQIFEVILAKEKESLGEMALSELRTLRPENEVPEAKVKSENSGGLPGENPDMESEAPLPGMSPPPSTPSPSLPPPPAPT